MAHTSKRSPAHWQSTHRGHLRKHRLMCLACSELSQTPRYTDQVHALKYRSKKLFGLLNPTSCIATPCLFALRHSVSLGWGQNDARWHPATLEMHCCRACAQHSVTMQEGAAPHRAPGAGKALHPASWLLQAGAGLPTAPASELDCVCLRHPMLPQETSASPETQHFQTHVPKSLAQPYLDCTFVIFTGRTRNLKKQAMKKAFCLAARALCEHIHQTCKQQVAHPMFVFHLKQGECA